MDETIIKEWLKSLSLVQYTESFIDNGYDDLEICKQIEAPDLDAIGVVNHLDRTKILQAVWKLKVEGAASVYFTIEEAQAASGDVDKHIPNSANEKIRNRTSSPSLGTNVSNSATENQEIDAYEAGKAELVRFPNQQLQKFVEEQLQNDRINLTLHPYSSPNGERGILEGLASRYADILNTHYQDVLDHLESIRSRQWNDFINVPKDQQRSQALQNLDPSGVETDSSLKSLSPLQCEYNGDGAIYVPGKYNPSSCLSDAEEDQIYGFAKPVCPPLAVNNPLLPVYLNPRSQCIYELPPSQKIHNGTKRRLGISRFLKTLKRDLKLSVDFRNKATSSQNVNLKFAPENAEVSGTPLGVLPGYSSPASSHCSHSSRSQCSGGPTVVATSISAPGTPGTGPMRDSGLQYTIEKLKEEEIQRRREYQYLDQKQILEDVRNGLKQSQHMSNIRSAYSHPMNLLKEVKRGYDNQLLSLAGTAVVGSGRRPLPSLPLHWYDEPPYESDPEDFAASSDKRSTDMEKLSGSGSKLAREELVISLKTAGDISLPKDVQVVLPFDPRALNCGCPDVQNTPVALNPASRQTPVSKTYNLTPRIEEHRDYLKMEGFKPGLSADHLDSVNFARVLDTPVSGTTTHSQSYRCLEQQSSGNPFTRYFPNTRFTNVALYSYKSENLCSPREKGSDGARELLSVSSSSMSSLNDEKERKESDSLMGRMKMLQRDMQRKISCLKNGNKTSIPLSSDLSNYSNADLRERLLGRSAVPFSKRQNSLPAKLKLSQARALVDYRPSPSEENALGFKKGSIIDVIAKTPSGLWQGHLNGKVGCFKSSLVEEIEMEGGASLAGMGGVNPGVLVGGAKQGLVSGVNQGVIGCRINQFALAGTDGGKSRTLGGVNQGIFIGGPNQTTLPGIGGAKPAIGGGVNVTNPCGFGLGSRNEAIVAEQVRDDLRAVLVKCGLGNLIQVFLENGYRSIGQFVQIRPNDLNHLGILDPDSQVQVMGAVNALKMSIRSRVETDAGHPQISLGSHEKSLRLPVKLSPLEDCYGRYTAEQIYENASKITSTRDDYSFDPFHNHSLRSSSSTDTSSGYHSRQTFNIPVSLSSESPLFDHSHPGSPLACFRPEVTSSGAFNGHSSPKRRPPVLHATASGDMPGPGDDGSSYRAQVACVISPSSSNSSHHN